VPRSLEEFIPRRPPLFWWLLANLLALCFAILSWVFCLEVFGNPEVPRNYELLKKLDRLPEIEAFKPSEAPEGSALGPEEIYRKFFGLSEDQCEKLELEWKRDYLTNFEEPLGLVYVHGTFQVDRGRSFSKQDYLIDGFAVQSRAMVKPDDFTKAAPYPVVVEFMFPSSETGALEQFEKGHVFEVPKSGSHAWVVMHISKIWVGDEQGILLSAIPITKGPCRYGSGVFSIETPQEVRPRMGFPVFGSDALRR